MDYYITYNELGEYGFLTPDLHGLEYCEQEGTLVSPDVYEYLTITQNIILDIQAIEADGEVRIEHAHTVIQDMPEALVREEEREKARNMLFDLLLEDYLGSGRITDEQKKNIMALYDKWDSRATYQQGSRVTFNESVYENVTGVNNGSPIIATVNWNEKKAPELSEAESMMLAIAEIDAQRELDKVESEMAIAELAEALMGGVLKWQKYITI